MGELIQLILSIGVSTISLVGFVITFIKNNKNKGSVKTLEVVILLNQVISNIPKYIKEAEAIFGGTNGLAKINYTLTKLQMDCVKNGVEFDEDMFKGKFEEILETPQKKLIKT